MLMQPHHFVQARLYESEEAVIEDAMRHLLRGRPDLRVQIAIHRYQQDGLSLAKAAQIEGVSWAQMCDILTAQGVTLRFGPDNMREAQEEVSTLERCFNSLV